MMSFVQKIPFDSYCHKTDKKDVAAVVTWLKLYCPKVKSTEEMTNFGDYPGDFIP